MMIDGLYVGDMAGKEVREHLRGDIGTTVSLTILRGDEVRHVTVTRGKMGDRPKRPPKEETIAP
jgi:C-terminal processing protease CtpA/Prc